jgi:hypothetical protein
MAGVLGRKGACLCSNTLIIPFIRDCRKLGGYFFYSVLQAQR